jgi:hypothetical protein
VGHILGVILLPNESDPRNINFPVKFMYFAPSTCMIYVPCRKGSKASMILMLKVIMILMLKVSYLAVKEVRPQGPRALMYFAPFHLHDFNA